MKKRRSSSGLFGALKRFHRRLHSPRLSVRNRAQRTLALIICIPLILVSLIYIVSWMNTKRSIERNNAYYRELYRATAAPSTAAVPSVPAATAAPGTPTRAAVAPMRDTPVPTAEPTPEPTAAPTSEPTAAPTAEATKTPTARPTEIISIIASTPTPAPTDEVVTLSPAPVSTEEPPRAEDTALVATPTPDDPLALDIPITPRPTADADTLIFAIETPPPVQESFKRLLELNDEAVGYLTINEAISLPVVRRARDNEFYLNHDFSRNESLGGTLFLDGMNLISPEDPNLIVYGHNMKNGTMFRELLSYADFAFLREHAVAQFDTLYRNRSYVPFAVLTAGMIPGDDSYLDIRRFSFDPGEFEEFVTQLREASMYDIPIGVQEGDALLLLVTCEYTHDNGRFIVAWRALREGEDEAALRDAVKRAVPKK